MQGIAQRLNYVTKTFLNDGDQKGKIGTKQYVFFAAEVMPNNHGECSEVATSETFPPFFEAKKLCLTDDEKTIEDI